MTRDDLRIWLFLAAVWLIGSAVLYGASWVERRIRNRRILRRHM